MLHYMTMPVLVTIVGALVGNILGYTVFEDVCAAMYYGSYSLPTYVTVWNLEAFWLTTLVPALIMLIVNSAVLYRSLRLSPLKFLRERLIRKETEKSYTLKSENDHLYQISPPGDFPEHEQLCCAVPGNFVCKPASVFRTSAAVGALPLSGGNSGQSAG